MDPAKEPSSAIESTPAAAFTTALYALRERSRKLLREQTERLRELEDKLGQQFTSAVERFEHEPRELAESEQQSLDRVEQLEREVRNLQQLRRESDQALDEARLMLGELEQERMALRDRLDKAESRPAENAPAAANTEETERLNRRLEMAMQEIRDLKSQNSELAEQVKRPPTGSRTSESSSGGFDWESQKRRLMEQLESSFDTNDATQAKEKLRCQDVMRATDRSMAEKDRELAELRKELEVRSRAIEAGAKPSTAAEEVLAADELIQSERSRLAQMQAEWQEKLRQAEVEISIERAKLARERMQMEEKLRLQASQTSADANANANTGGDSKAPTRGKWLSRLGLSGDKDST